MFSDLNLGPSFKVERWFTGFGELSFRWIQICIGSPMCRSSLSWERDFGCHLEFWWKLKMSFISKSDKVISSNVLTLWVLETLDIVPVKKVEFPEFCQPS